MSSVLDLEERSIELELREVRLERKLNDLKMKRLMLSESEPLNGVPVESVKHELQLNYAKSTTRNLMRIADVKKDGAIGIYSKNDSIIYSTQYNVQSLKWICKKLPSFAKRQRVEKKFFDKIACEYSRKFVKISDTTMEKLCYLVDSGAFDVWFDKYNNLKSKQSKLME